MPGQLTKQDVFATTEYRCWYCGDPARVLDHVIPKALGGVNALSNRVAACNRCNARKGSKTLEQYREFCGEKLGGWVFTRFQVAYLESIGVTLPEAPAWIFWAEIAR